MSLHFAKPDHRAAQRWVISSAIVFSIFLLALFLNRYFTFYSTYDQGIFNQVYWNALRGEPFQSSLSSQLSTNVVHNGELPNVSYHRLGQHFTPALSLWLPIYALFPSPITLGILQIVLLTAAGFVLYQLAQEYVSAQLAAWLVVSFYGANAILGPALGNFSDICQIPLFVFTLFWALERRWWWLFGLMSLLIPLVREDAGITLFGIGIYLVLSRRYPRIGLILCILSFSYILILTNLIMPIFSEDIAKRFMLERFGQYATGDEASTLEIIGGMMRNPLRLLRELVTPMGGTIKYLLGQWLPLAFVPALSPAAWAIAGFPLLKLFLATGQSVLSINIRYAMTVVPGLFYGAILWWAQRPTGFQRLPIRRFWQACIVLSIIFTLTSNPHRSLYFLIPESIDPWVRISLSDQWRHARQVWPLLEQIPDEASVSATTFLIPHLSSRREVIRIPFGLQLRNDEGTVVWVDYAIADLWSFANYAEFDQEREWLVASLHLIDQELTAQRYGVIDFAAGTVLLKHLTVSDPAALAAWQAYREEVLAQLGTV